MSEFNILIYEKEVLDIELFKYVCKQYKMTPFSSDTIEKAKEILKNNEIDFAVVNYSMLKLDLDKKIKVIATGEADQASGVRIIQYLPVSFVPKPISISSISLALHRAIGGYSESKSYISSMVNINEFLIDLKFKLSSFSNDKNPKLTFLSSVDKFCKTICKFSENESEVNKDQFSEYTVLDYFSSRGVIYCKFKKVCRLWNFTEYLKEKLPGQEKKTPYDLIKNTQLTADSKIFFEMLENVISEYEDELDKLYELKIEYCKTICNDRKKDLEFLKGDNMFSTVKEMMAGNVFYCTFNSCPVDNFFELFQKKVI